MTGGKAIFIRRICLGLGLELNFTDELEGKRHPVQGQPVGSHRLKAYQQGFAGVQPGVSPLDDAPTAVQHLIEIDCLKGRFSRLSGIGRNVDLDVFPPAKLPQGLRVKTGIGPGRRCG